LIWPEQFGLKREKDDLSKNINKVRSANRKYSKEIKNLKSNLSSAEQEKDRLSVQANSLAQQEIKEQASGIPGGTRPGSDSKDCQDNVFF
jgi:chromosome segregation ATPase